MVSALASEFSSALSSLVTLISRSNLFDKAVKWFERMHRTCVSLVEVTYFAIEHSTVELQFDINQGIGGLKSLLAECKDDEDVKDMATEELGQATEEEKRLQYLVLRSILPKDDADE